MKEQLSALIDGEISLQDAQHVLTSLKTGGEMKDAWRQYHFIGDALRGEYLASHDMTDKIMSAISHEPTVLAPNSNINVDTVQTEPAVAIAAKINNTFANTKLWSIAASVAAVMFVGVMLLQNQTAPNDTLAPVQLAQELPMEYLAAHQSAAPSSVSYYIQPASFNQAMPVKQ
jgi:sigma-E factor negative regulatory protein RseA